MKFNISFEDALRVGEIEDEEKRTRYCYYVIPGTEFGAVHVMNDETEEAYWLLNSLSGIQAAFMDVIIAQQPDRDELPDIMFGEQERKPDGKEH